MEGSSQGWNKGEVEIHVDSIGVSEVKLREGEVITFIFLRVKIVLCQSEGWNLYDLIMVFG